MQAHVYYITLMATVLNQLSLTTIYVEILLSFYTDKVSALFL